MTGLINDLRRNIVFQYFWYFFYPLASLRGLPTALLVRFPCATTLEDLHRTSTDLCVETMAGEGEDKLHNVALCGAAGAAAPSNALPLQLPPPTALYPFAVCLTALLARFSAFSLTAAGDELRPASLRGSETSLAHGHVCYLQFAEF